MNDFSDGGVVPTQMGTPMQIGDWLAGVCESIPHTLSAVFVFGPPDVGPYAPLAFWPAEKADATRLADVAEQALAERKNATSLVDPDARGLAIPVEFDGHLHGVFALEIANGSERELQLALQKMKNALTWVEAWFRREDRAISLGVEERLMAVLDMLGAVLEESEFEPACRTLVTELSTRLQCDRVSLGVVRSGHAEIVALSHSAQIGKRMNLINAVGAAMDEAIDQRALIRYPASPGDEIVVTRDHERLGVEHGSGCVLTVPMAGSGRLTGALLFERPASMPFQDEELSLAQAVGAVLARILELKQLNERSLALRFVDACGEQARRLVGPRYVKRKLFAALLLIAVVFFTYADGQYRVTAPATLEGSVRRKLAAPFDGYIATANARAGDVTREGDVLATMDDREMRLDRMKWVSQYGQYIKQHQEAVANRDRAKSQIVQALYEQAAAQVAMIDSQLQRVSVTAPFDGVIVMGDLSQSLGSALKRGETIFEIAPLAGYRVIVNVDERDIADVVSGQKGVLILSSITQESFPFTVGNVTSVTTAREGRNYFRVEAMLENAMDRLRPGMEGVAKIDVEPRRLFWIWTHRVVDWLRIFFWTYGP
jgi:multidrug resistance efflux pump